MKTVVTVTNKDYLVGTYVLLHSLLKNGNLGSFTFHVLYNDDFDIEEFDRVASNIAFRWGMEENMGFTYEKINFSEYGDKTIDFYKNALAKFSIFNLDLDEFLFLDSDMLILDDISELFELESDFSACIDMGTPNEFNTGLMYIKKPCLGKDKFEYLLKSAKNNFSYRGDQEHINAMISHPNILPSTYNMLKDRHRHLGSWISGVKVLHYISKKPWTPYNPSHHKAGNLECLDVDKLWMRYFNDLKATMRINHTLLKDRTELVKHVAELYPGGYGVEVGVQRGEFSKTILKNWDCETLYLVDPWEEYDGYKNDLGAVSQEKHNENLNMTKENTISDRHRVELIRDYSINAAEEFHDESLDFVYLDARHDKEGIKEDIEAWWPKVKQGGILAGHDYTNLKQGDNHIEVKEVVDDYFDKANCTLDGPYPSWWVKKS